MQTDQQVRERRAATIDGGRFRQVLGHYPTGVVVATATSPDGVPVGMAVGSFTSVSLDPPLVAFLPDKSSSTFPKIRTAGAFCINVLAGDQEGVCRAFAARGADKYAGVPWRPSPGTGSPVLEGAVAWIDCDIEDVVEAGDHYIVLGRVRDLATAGEPDPLLFFRGGYGRFTPSSLSAPAEPDLLTHLRVMDVARGEMEALAAHTGLECLAVTVVGDEMVTLGSAGTSYGEAATARIGQRMPFVPPLGTLFVAWAGESAVSSWIARLGSDLHPGDERVYNEMVRRVRDRGWSMALASRPQIAFELALRELSVQQPTPQQQDAVRAAARHVGTASHEPPDLDPQTGHHVRNISAPVFDATGTVVLQLTLIGLSRDSHLAEVLAHRSRLSEATDRITQSLGGRLPESEHIDD